MRPADVTLLGLHHNIFQLSAGRRLLASFTGTKYTWPGRALLSSIATADIVVAATDWWNGERADRVDSLICRGNGRFPKLPA